MPSIRILICDLDGVIRHFDPHAQARVDTTYGLARGTIARIAFSPAHLIPAVAGLVSDEEWRSGITGDLAGIIGENDAHDAVAAWSADIGTVDPCVLDLLRHVRERCPVILFSNATSRLRQDLSSLSLTSEVDAVVNSAETGAPKPQREAFVATDEAIERLLGYPPRLHEILFIDDNTANVAAGARYGWMTRLFLGAADFAQLLHSVRIARWPIRPSAWRLCAPIASPTYLPQPRDSPASPALRFKVDHEKQARVRGPVPGHV